MKDEECEAITQHPDGPWHPNLQLSTSSIQTMGSETKDVVGQYGIVPPVLVVAPLSPCHQQHDQRVLP